MIVNASKADTLYLDTFTTSPSFFKLKGEDIRKMDIKQSLEYLNDLKKIQPDIYYEKLTEFYSRIFESVIILVMMIVSLSINLKGKKNAMMFSLISSLAIAVVYYALNMATTLLAKQGMASPLLAHIIPVTVVLIFSIFGISRVST